MLISGPYQANSFLVPPPRDRLDSSKEIAAYLNRGIRTVQRWEQEEGLPVHRLAHEKRGTVHAYKQEVDDWLQSRVAQLGDGVPEASETGAAKPRYWKSLLEHRATRVASISLSLTRRHNQSLLCEVDARVSESSRRSDAENPCHRSGTGRGAGS